MTLKIFQSLPAYRQDYIVFTYENLIDFNQKDDIVISLYSVYLFFVEYKYELIKNILSSRIYQTGKVL